MLFQPSVSEEPMRIFGVLNAKLKRSKASFGPRRQVPPRLVEAPSKRLGGLNRKRENPNPALVHRPAAEAMEGLREAVGERGPVRVRRLEVAANQVEAVVPKKDAHRLVAPHTNSNHESLMDRTENSRSQEANPLPVQNQAEVARRDLQARSLGRKDRVRRNLKAVNNRQETKDKVRRKTSQEHQDRAPIQCPLPCVTSTSRRLSSHLGRLTLRKSSRQHGERWRSKPTLIREAPQRLFQLFRKPTRRLHKEREHPRCESRRNPAHDDIGKAEAIV